MQTLYWRWFHSQAQSKLQRHLNSIWQCIQVRLTELPTVTNVLERERDADLIKPLGTEEKQTQTLSSISCLHLSFSKWDGVVSKWLPVHITMADPINQVWLLILYIFLTWLKVHMADQINHSHWLHYHNGHCTSGHCRTQWQPVKTEHHSLWNIIQHSTSK